MMTRQKRTDFPSSTVSVSEVAVVLVRTLLTCSLHDEASSENQRRVQTHAEPWQEWKNTKFQSPKFQILHTSVNKYKDKCRSASSNHAQPYRTNIRCTLTGRGPRLDLSPCVITGWVICLTELVRSRDARLIPSSFITFRISKWWAQVLTLVYTWAISTS